MPQYELMYILSSTVADSDEPEVTKTIGDFIMSLGGSITKEEKLGKKRLAYPIKKTRNGFYVLFQFNMPTDKINELDHKIRVTPGIIRHLILNLDEQLDRMDKDREEQRIIKRKMQAGERASQTREGEKRTEIPIDLDKQIEKALEEDLTKNT